MYEVADHLGIVSLVCPQCSSTHAEYRDYADPNTPVENKTPDLDRESRI